jgi:lysozyme
MKTSPAGRKVLAEREGRRLKAYRDSAGVWTIGIGHTSMAGPPRVTPGLTVTDAECDAIFARDLVSYEAAVTKAVKVPMDQHEFDALVSLCYNIGPAGLARSTVVRRLNAGDRRGAGEAFLMWNKPAEIRGRRRGERAQFLGQVYAARLRPDEKPKILPTQLRKPAREPKPVLPTAAIVAWWRRLFAPHAKPTAVLFTENPDMFNPTLPLAVFDLIRRAVEKAAERPEVDIPAEQKGLSPLKWCAKRESSPRFRNSNRPRRRNRNGSREAWSERLSPDWRVWRVRSASRSRPRRSTPSSA